MTDSELPADTDVLVIGAGANGLFTAWNLARRGVRVTICEKGEVAAESSSRAFGWISGLLLDPSKTELSLLSLREWAGAEAATGNTGFRTDGLCYFGSSDSEIGAYEEWRDLVAPDGYTGIEILDRSGVKKRFPNMTKEWLGGIVAHGDGCIEPKLAIPAIADAARQAGVKIVSLCAVRGLDWQGGKINGAITEKGKIRAQKVVFAGNLWSRLFLGREGINIPQLYAIMTMGSTTVAPNGPIGCGGQEDWAWRKQQDGAYSLGRLRGQSIPVTRDILSLFPKFIPMMKMELHNIRPSFGMQTRQDFFWPRKWSMDEPGVFEKFRIYNPPVNTTVPEKSLYLNKKNISGFSDAGIVETWSGAITFTPDNLPIAGKIANHDALYILTGCSYGLTWAPALGRMLAEMIVGQKPCLNPAPYRLERFFDGSPIVVKA
ncbi:FAD-binding oxidoreductase [Acetobacter senegalensis]|uniref:NAD(P)/FAD-dependent oxidoreductase n=1 Tax=Acetobacter senegalensis TaxID=446692 RepID=UPI001ED9D42C|nr:FAD-binding oxidoreductase [Acetobacter senegalensis]MCG4262439.1 FAD-binding oxidoreductase [Acetobacter senegalensis]